MFHQARSFVRFLSQTTACATRATLDSVHGEEIKGLFFLNVLGWFSLRTDRGHLLRKSVRIMFYRCYDNALLRKHDSVKSWENAFQSNIEPM